jgi:hypothetical protein
MKKFLILLSIFTITFNCKPAALAMAENKQDAEVIEIINKHLINVNLKNNVSLQRLIKHVGIQANEFFANQEITPAVIDQVTQQVLQNIDKQKYIGLPIALNDVNNFAKFVNILVNRYTKNLNQFLTKFNAKINNASGQKNGLPKVLQNKVKEYFLIDWDQVSNILTYTIHHNSWVDCVAFSPCRKFLGTASSDNTARVTNIKPANLFALLIIIIV